MNTPSPVLNYSQKEELVNQLRSLMKNNEQLKKLPHDNDDYLLRFLYSCKFDVIAAFDRMKYYYELLVEFPDWFQKKGPVYHKSLIERDMRVMTSNRDKAGRPIYIVKVGNMSTSMNMLDIVNIDDIWLEYIASDAGLKSNGLSVIIDIKNFSLQLMRWMTPHNLKVAIKKMEALPVRELKFHVVNSSFFINIPIKALWPFLPERMKKMIAFHFEDWDSLHEHISPEMLPPEYGGTNKLDFRQHYHKLYVKNDEIVSSFKSFRTI